jgi:lipopolysaccharide transport system permease protein
MAASPRKGDEAAAVAAGPEAGEPEAVAPAGEEPSSPTDLEDEAVGVVTPGPVGAEPSAVEADDAAPASARPEPETWRLEPRGEGTGAGLVEAIRYRRLVRFFAARAIERRYRRTVLGRLWLVLRPLLPVVVAALVFGRLLDVRSDGKPYFIFLLVGMAPWTFFAGAVTWATRSLEINRGFLRRIYVPRLIVPIATTSPAILEFGINLCLIAATAIGYRIATGNGWVQVGPGWLAALGASVAALALGIGIGFWTSVYAARARDVRFALGYVLSLWQFVTPVIYPVSVVPERWRILLDLNPLTGIVTSFRWGLLGDPVPETRSLVAGGSVLGVVLLSGIWFFLRKEADSVDKI